ncbi:50S ribosomal protein L5 [Candidatus Nomurabacteria bacterium]|nr:50S ribosomal protein L5 [Candidatus Nomurabacteria bacterium]
MKILKEKESNTVKALSEFGYKNSVSAPRLTKVSISVGTGSMMKKDREKNDLVADRLAKITGQKPALRAAKKSVAGFKSRQGDPVGLVVTLRGARMYHFMDKLINIALPRTKDFRGIDPKSVDSIGNMTIGIKEHTIFPETSDEDLRDVFGLAITIGTTAKNKKEALAYFTHIGIPFKK